MLSPAPATLQHGRDTDRAEVSSLPGAGPKPGLPAASLAHLLGIMVQNSARVILALGSVQCHHTAGAGLGAED